MSSQLDFDRVLEDWLTRGPSQLPERAIQETVGQLDQIPQQGRLRLMGNERMQRLILSATGVAAALVFAVLAYASLTGGLQFGAPSGIPFTSERHGYTVVLPDDSWTVEERPGSWDTTADFFDANSGDGVDYFEHLDADGEPTTYVYLASQEIPIGTTFDEWVGLHDAANRRVVPCFGLQGDYEQRTVDGEAARLAIQNCADFNGEGQWTTVQILLQHNGRAYAIYVWPAPGPGTGLPDSVLRDDAAKWLSRFSFTD